jgi:metal-responsive CopG/Arc/MetJ family transcriptional regulator
MTRITRVGVTFPPELLEDFDKIIGTMGYESRSKAIQDACSPLCVREKMGPS